MGFIKKLLGTGIATAATAAVGSLATDPNSAWYKSLKKPEWQPPSAALPIVRTALSATIAAASAKVLNDLDKQEEAALTPARREKIAKQRRGFKWSLGANLALNAGWSALFWQGRNLALTAAGAGVLAASSAGLARRAGKVSTGAGIVLAPYALWTVFASGLSAKLAQLND